MESRLVEIAYQDRVASLGDFAQRHAQETVFPVVTQEALAGDDRHIVDYLAEEPLDDKRQAFFRGDASGIIQYARQALEYLPEQDLTWRSSAFVVLADAHSIQGVIEAAYQAQLDAVEACKEAGDIYLVMLAEKGTVE